jgi:hypothetical protein
MGKHVPVFVCMIVSQHAALQRYSATPCALVACKSCRQLPSPPS